MNRVHRSSQSCLLLWKQPKGNYYCTSLQSPSPVRLLSSCHHSTTRNSSTTSSNRNSNSSVCSAGTITNESTTQQHHHRRRFSASTFQHNLISTHPSLSISTSPQLSPLSSSSYFSTFKETHHNHNHHHYNDIQITGVSDEVNEKIKQYAHKQQTSTSLLTLMKTGRGEFLHKTYKDHKDDWSEGDKVATDKILMQVSL